MEHQKKNKKQKTKGFDIRWSEVRFLMGTQNFFFVPRSWQNEKHLSLKTSLLFHNISPSRLTSKPRLRALDPAFQGRIQTTLRWLTQLGKKISFIFPSRISSCDLPYNEKQKQFHAYQKTTWQDVLVTTHGFLRAILSCASNPDLLSMSSTSSRSSSLYAFFPGLSLSFSSITKR